MVLGVWKALAVSGHETLGAVLGAVMGLAVYGTAQWLVLRRPVPRAGWWALSSVVGLAAAGLLGGALVGVLSEALGLGERVAEVIFAAVFGAVYGASTGGVLVWLLRRQG